MQAHCPVQVSVSRQISPCAVQSLHALPRMPQESLLCVWHIPPLSQQPPQLLGPQDDTQVPLEHLVPAGQVPQEDAHVPLEHEVPAAQW